MEPQRPWLSSLTHAALIVNRQLQTGNHGITFRDIYTWLDSGELWQTLEKRLPRFDVFGLLTKSESPQPQLLIETLRDVAEETQGDEENDLGLTEGGLSLLLGLILVAIQSNRWMASPEREATLRPGPPPPRN